MIMKNKKKRYFKIFLWTFAIALFDLVTWNYFPSHGHSPIPWRENVKSGTWWIAIIVAFIYISILVLIHEPSDEEDNSTKDKNT